MEDCTSRRPTGHKVGPMTFYSAINDLNIPSADGIFKYVDDTTIHEVLEKGSNSLMQSHINEVSE